MNILLINTLLCLAFAQKTINSNIYKQHENIKSTYISIEKPIMTLTIPSIGVKNSIYSKNSKKNNIDKNVIIMNESSLPNEEKGNVILGAHSGSGPLAYFKNFDKLKINDEIFIEYENQNYKYIIKSIYDDNKDGKIRIINNDIDILTLYTCKPNDKNNYLIIIAIKEN